MLVLDVVIRFSMYEGFSIVQPTIIKLRTYIDDNVVHNRTVSDLQVVLFILI